MTAVSEPIEVDLAELVREHQAEVWRYLRFLGAAAADADDLTQETFLAVARSTFEARSRPETTAYLRTVARNQLLMARRRDGRQIDTVDLAAAEAVWAEAAGDDGLGGYLDALAECVSQLEGRAQDAVHRFYQNQEGRTEIAEALGMKPDGVKTLLRRTRDLLRQCIERRMNNEKLT
jgi:RNA polymerase sigma-70 factor, ECF subfamily